MELIKSYDIDCAYDNVKVKNFVIKKYGSIANINKLLDETTNTVKDLQLFKDLLPKHLLEKLEGVKVCISSNNKFRELLDGLDLPLNSVPAMTTTLGDITFIGINSDILNLPNARDILTEVIMHELVHYEQIVRGDLIINQNEGVFWKGAHYALEYVNFINRQAINKRFPYGDILRICNELPWELEAYGSVYQRLLEAESNGKIILEDDVRPYIVTIVKLFESTF